MMLVLDRNRPSEFCVDANEKCCQHCEYFFFLETLIHKSYNKLL